MSRRFVVITKAQMDEWFARRLDGIDIVVVLLDGVYIADHVVLVAAGVASYGKKHVLGIREGAAENATACREMLVDLRQPGLSTEKTTLFVLDGAKALRKAVVEVWAEHAKIQRCQAHEIRNVMDQLPEYMRSTVGATMRQACSCNNVVHARKLLQNLARTGRAEHPSAAASLDEGPEETLTMMAMKLPRNLERVLSTTNIIET